LVSTRDDYRLPAALIAAVRAVIIEQLIDPNLWTFWTEQTRSGRSRSSATLYDATRCSDRTRYPDGRMVATAPPPRRSIRDAANEFPRILLPRTRVNRPVERVRGCNRNRPLCVCGSTRPTGELHGRTAQDPAQRAGPDRLGSVSTETRPSSLALAKNHSFMVCTVLYLGTTLPLLRSWLSGCVGAAGPSTSAYLLKGRDPVGSGPTLISYFILRSFIQDAAMRTSEDSPSTHSSGE
jgi:hypothetical protein